MKPIQEAFSKFGNFSMRAGVCETHGEFTSFALGKGEPPCPDCVDERAKKESVERAIKTQTEAMRNGMHLPARFADTGFKDWNTGIAKGSAEIVFALKGYVSSLKQNRKQWRPLILTGTVGTGKSHLICAVIKNLVEFGVSARYTTLLDMLSDIKSAYSDNSKTEASMIGIYAHSSDLLVIDEVDLHRWSENDKMLMFAVINGRYNDMRPVAIVSNKTPEELPDYITNRVMDRLSENATTLRCGWESARRRSA